MKHRGPRILSAAQRISMAAMAASLSLVCLYLASIAPTLRITLYVLSSLFIAALLIEGEVLMGWIMYLGVCMLGSVLIQDKVRLLPYVVFFGNYGIVKYYTEKLGSLVGEFILKLIYWNAVLVLTVNLAKRMLLADIRLDFPVWGIIVLAQIAFLIYDYVFSRIIEFYYLRIRRYVMRG
ncbi:MAG: hypothetical protein ACOX6S_02410 [Clostridia bacterium]|jgi:hypothetical protein